MLRSELAAHGARSARTDTVTPMNPLIAAARPPIECEPEIPDPVADVLRASTLESFAHHDDLLLVGQVDPDDRVLQPARTRESSEFARIGAVILEQATTVGHDVLLSAIWPSSREAHQETFIPPRIDMQNLLRSAPAGDLVASPPRLTISGCGGMTLPDHPQVDEHRDDLPGPGVAAALAMLTRHLDRGEGAIRRSHHLPSMSADRSERSASMTWMEAPVPYRSARLWRPDLDGLKRSIASGGSGVRHAQWSRLARSAPAIPCRNLASPTHGRDEGDERDRLCSDQPGDR